MLNQSATPMAVNKSELVFECEVRN